MQIVPQQINIQKIVNGYRIFSFYGVSPLVIETPDKDFGIQVIKSALKVLYENRNLQSGSASTRKSIWKDIRR